jgi:diguanylate cyclase
MPIVSYDEILSIVSQMDQTIYNHEQWAKALTRNLICKLTYDQCDVDQDAHRKCRFGQWYYEHAPSKIHNYPAFIAMASEHEHLHQLAANLLLLSSKDKSISAHDFDTFAEVFERLRLQIHNLKHELSDSLYKFDSLTGAKSRTTMLTELREQQELVKRRVQHCSIAVMDIDHFKAVNDTYGHPAGDAVLAASTRYIIERLRPYDKVFRYRGEEFLICMLNTDEKLAHEVLERLRVGLSQNTIECNGKDIVCITASFGIALIDPDINVEQSIDRADKAMYAAKMNGCNCTRIWDASL